MSLLDLLLGLILLASVIAGFTTGFARVGIGFAASIAGLLFGFWFYAIPAEWLHKLHFGQTAANFVGFFIIFFAFVAAGSLVGLILSKLFKWTGLSFVDKLLGGVFGLVRGVLVAAVFTAVLLAFSPHPVPNWIVNSRLLPYEVEVSDACAALAPHALKQAFDDGLAEIRRDWEAQFKRGRRGKQPSRFKGTDN